MEGSIRREQVDPAADLFDRWMTHHQAEPRPVVEAPRTVPTQRVEPDVVPEATPPRAAPARSAPPARPSRPAVGLSTNVEFTPRTRARGLLGWLLFVSALGLVGAAFIAAGEPTTLSVGISGTLLVLVLLLWAIRAASPVAHLKVRAGQLEVVRGGERFVLDLGAAYTPIEVIGTPGERRWKVLFMRPGMEPFVVDASMVDPREFMDVLRRYRPR
jgi:hypothetical protein